MTNLTDQWNKGELPSGWYWCKCYNEETKLLYCDGDSFELDDPETKNYYFFLPKDVAEITILASVPSYEEFQNLKEYEQIVTSYNMKPIDYDIACETVNKLLDERKSLKEQNAQLKSKLQLKETAYDFDTARLEEENAQLKELLRECKQYIDIWGYTDKHGNLLLPQIDEVLK